MKKFILPLLLLLAVGMLVAVESAPSAVVGYVKYPCYAGNNMIALPMNQTIYTMASEVGANVGVYTLSYFDGATQGWVSCNYIPDFDLWDGDFPVANGDQLMINATAAFDFYSIGSMPSTMPSYTLYVGNNTIMIPLNRSDLTLASGVGVDMGVYTLSYFDGATQGWVSCNYIPDFDLWDGDYDTAIGLPLMVNATAAGTWPTRASHNFNTKSK